MASQEDRCNSCGDHFRGKSHVSSIYGSKGVLLCKPCGEVEEDIIENQGTNDVPWLLKQYESMSILLDKPSDV